MKKNWATNVRWKIAQWAERKWWKNYLKNKNVQDYLLWKKNYWEHFLQSIQLENSIQAHHSVVDLGCGPAGIFMLFNSKNTTALDPLIDNYQKDLEHFDKKNYPEIEFINSDIEAYKPEKKFDFIFCINAINHVDSIEKGFLSLTACAHEKSTLIISIDAHNYALLKKIFQLIPGDILHPHQYSLNDYKNMLIAHDWRIEQCILKDKAFIFNYYILVAKRN